MDMLEVVALTAPSCFSGSDHCIAFHRNTFASVHCSYFDSGNNRSSCCIAPERLVKGKDLEAIRAAGTAAGSAVASSLPSSSLPSTAAADLARAGLLAEETGSSLSSSSLYGSSGAQPCAPSLRESMDIFSLGCTIAETVLDGEAFFEQHSLLKYKSGGSVGVSSSSAAPGVASGSNAAGSNTAGAGSVASAANQSAGSGSATAPSSSSGGGNANSADFDPMSGEGYAEYFKDFDPSGTVRDLVMHMIQRNPLRRSSARQYLETHTSRAAPVSIGLASSGPVAFSSGASFAPPALSFSSVDKRLFPAWFPYLFSFFSRLVQPDMSSPDHQILAVAAAYPNLISNLAEGRCDPVGDQVFAHRLALEAVRGEPFRKTFSDFVASMGRAPVDWSSSSSSAAGGNKLGGRRKRRRDGSDGKDLHFSAGAQHAADVKRELQWEWGWEGGASSAPELWSASSQWSCDFSDVADPALRQRLQRGMANGSLTAIHEKWIQMKWASVPLEQPAASSVGGSAAASSATMPSSDNDATLPPPQSAAFHPRLMSVGSVASQGQRTNRSGGGNTGGAGSSTGARAFALQERIGALLNDADALLTSILNDTAPAPVADAIDQQVDGHHSRPRLASAPSPSPVPPAAHRFTGRQQVASHQQQQFTTKLVPAEPAEIQASALILALLTSTLRRVTNPRTKLTAIALISRISAYTDDEVRLERVVPYLTTMFNDTSPLVRAHALASLTCVLESITNFPLSDSTLFPHYILPLVTRMTQDAEPIVQMACGECVPSLVRTAKRFLDIGQWRSQSAAVQKAVAAAAAATARSAASAASAAVSAAAPVPSSTLPPAGSAESGTDELSSPSPVGDSGMLSPSVSASGATSSFTFPASSSSSAAIGQLGAAADLLDPTALARIKSTHDTDMAYLRRKVHNLLQKWVLNMTQYATATAAQVVLEDPAMMRLAIMNKRYESLDAKGTFHGVDVTTDDNIISSAAILRLSDAIKSLPLVVDTSLMKRSLLAGSGIADLCAFFGREATEESVLPLLFTFLSDPAISIVLNTAGPAVVPVIVPIAGGGGASGAISSRTVNNGSSGDMLGSGSSGSIMTSQLTSLVLSWLNKSDLGGGDWQLRDAFLSKLVEVAAFVGPYNTQVQLLPFFEQAINAPYEAIVKRAFVCLAELTLMRTLPKRTLLDLLNKYTCLLVHPGARVRQGVATFAAAVWQLLGWPSALMDTGSAINPYVLETRGDAVWSAIAAHLTHVGPSTSLQPAKALVQALLSSIMKPLSRSQYDAEAHSFVVSAMMDASPGLAARLRASRQPQQSAGQDGLGASFSMAPVDPLIRPGSDDARRGSSNPAHDYDSDLEEDLGYNPHDNEDDQHDGIAISGDDDAGALRALDAASVAAAGGIGLESAAAPLQYGGPASSLCQFAPAFASKSQRRQYIANQMRGYIRTTAGPYRLSASTCSRMAAHAFAKQQKEASLAQPSSAIYSSVVSLDQAIVQDLLAGSAAPPPPYTDEELASLPARSISFPDQRYVSVHPQPPAGAAAKTPNPQDTTSMTDRPEHSAAVSLLARDPFALAVSEQAVTAVAKFGGAVIDAAATGLSLAAPGDDGITSVVLTVPPIESTLGNNAPLPEDVFEYDRIISQRMKAATKALRSDAAALLHPDGPITGGAGGSAARPNTGSLSLVVGTRRRRSSSVSTATVRQQTTDAYSFLQAVQPVRSPVHSGVQLARLAGANSRSNSFVSFAMGDSASASRDRSDRDRDGSRDKIDSLSRRQSALASQPFASPDDASPLSPIQQALRLRSHWRRAGRTARRTYLRHGVWNPLLATDTAFAQAAGGMGVGTATAFFYSSGRAALHDDPTLYDSDTGGGGSSTSAGNARASSAALSLLPGAGAGADGKVRRGSKASASSVVGAARQAWGETMERRRSRAGTSDSSVSGSGGFAPQPSNASGGASSSQTGHERTSSNTSDPVTSNAGGAGTSSSAGGGGGVMLMGSDDGSGGGFYSSYGGGGSGNEPLDGDGPMIFPGSAPSDPRISAAVMAARFSAAAHAAITTSDGSAWAARTAGGAAGAAAGSAAAAQFAGSKGQGAAGNARASMALQGPLGSAQKRRAIVRKQSGILSTGGGTDDYGSMSTGSSGPAPQPQQPQPPAGASAEDASFVLTSYEAEQIVHKAGAYKVGQAGSSSNPSYSASGGASGNAGGASAASGQTAAGVIINPSYLGDGSSPAVSSANTASNSGKEAAKRKSTLFGSAAGTSNAVSNTRSKSIASASGAQGSSTNSGSAMYRGGDDRDFLSPAAAEALSRRIDALDLPPLPPHLGYLQKFSDPPAPVCAHAVRVATGVRPDAYSSVAVGVGSGVITSGGQGENTRQVLDESPLLAPQPNADDVALTASVLAGASSGSAAATVAIDGDAASGDVEVDGFTLVEGPSSSSSPMIRSRAAASDGRVPHLPLSSSAGIEGSLPVVPVPLPVPEREDLIRPADVGDASGYVGAGRVSFLAIERGWKDGIGVGAPPGSSLIASVGILPSSNAAATSAAAQASGVNASEAAPVGPAAAGSAASAAAGSANWDGGDGTWGSRPRGLLLTCCAEHGAAVNAVAVCQDHSFFASASDDGTVKVWPTRALDREVANQSLLTYTGHAQEVMLSRDIEKRLSSSPSLSTGSTKVNRVTDLCILDNTCSIASGSAAGTVHIYRIDLAAATSSKSGRMGTASGDMAGDDGGSAGGRGSMASPGQTGGILVSGNNAQQSSSKTVSFSAGAGPSHRQSLARFSSSADSGDNVMSSPLGPVGAGGAGDTRMLPMGSIAELDHDGNGDVDLDDFEPFGTGFGDAGDSESARSNMAYFRTPEGVTLVRRLVFDASEGPVAVLRHFDTATQSILAVAMANDIVHGCDIRSRKEAWCCRLPSSLGVITAMEVCPGSTSILVGTDRGCVALYDIRFNLITACWRHSGRAPVSVLYPYVTLGLRSASLPLGSQSSSSQQQPPVQVSVCRQLAVGIGTGEDETSFWNLETGTCLRILRNLPEKVEIADAFRVPFLTKISIVNGRVIPSDEAWLNGYLSHPSSASTSPGAASNADAVLSRLQSNGGRPDPRLGAHPLQAASNEYLLKKRPAHVRAILCPLPTATVPSTGLLGYPEDSLDPSRLNAEAISTGADAFGAASGGGGASGYGLGGYGAGAGQLGFVLGGMRGAGAVRRRGLGFATGYTASAAAGGSTAAAAAAVSGAAGVPSTDEFKATDPRATQLLQVYGSSPSEGLPVWLLTAGTDGRVRCWDLDRPRASHTVCGSLPAHPRDGYEGAWARPVDPQVWDGDETPNGIASSSAGEGRAASVASPSPGPQSPSAPSSSAAAAVFTLDRDTDAPDAELDSALAKMRIRDQDHFPAFCGSDGISLRRPVPNESVLAALGLSRRLFARAQYSYWYQRNHPVRTIFAMPLSTLVAEADAANGGIPQNPYLAMKGPLPSGTGHVAAVTAMAWIDLPTRLLITAGKDGVIKVWR